MWRHTLYEDSLSVRNGYVCEGTLYMKIVCRYVRHTLYEDSLSVRNGYVCEGTLYMKIVLV